MQVITFYSYKGGVGRTLALANIAQRLANDFGKTVAVMDFDLEAPGLHYKFQTKYSELKIEEGLVDYIYEYAINGKVEQFIEPFSTKILQYNHSAKPIYIIPAGNTNSSEYWRKLAAIDWHNLFYKPNSQGVNFILNLKKQIETELKPDFLLIDSRTGITEISGITISLLADDCVVVSVNNNENIAGSKQVIDSIKSPENAFFKTPNVHFVLSRIPYSTDPDIRGREIELKEFLKKRLSLPEIHVLHSDPELEWEESIKIGDIAQKDEVPIGTEYLSLFDAIVKPYLNESDHKHFEKIELINKLFGQAYDTVDRSEKVELYNEILKIDKTNSEALNSRAKIYFRTEKYEKALADFQKLGSRFFRVQIECLSNLKRYDEALKLTERLFKTSMKDESLYELKYKLLDKSEASQDVINAFFEDWENNADKTAEFYNARACWFLEKELFDKAKEDAQKAISLDVKFSLGYATLAEAHSAQGNDEAFFSNLELAFVFGLKQHITELLNIPIHIYSKYKDNPKFINLLKQYNTEVEFMTLIEPTRPRFRNK